MNRQKLIKEVANEVHGEMYSRINDGMCWMYWERFYGLARVCVEVTEVILNNGSVIDDVDVYVAHDDMTHESPLLEKAIRKALPNWFDVKREVEREQIA